jgi:REP element-mobilizing transposase RayT
MKMPKGWKNSEFEYSRKLPHYQRALQSLFLSFSTIEDFWLNDQAKEIVFNACRFNDGRLMDLHALVVMSTHVHLLFDMRFDSENQIIPMRKLTHSIKSYSAHEINKAFGLEGTVWQDESFDHVIRDQTAFEEKLLYIRMNPVKAGVVKRAEDYKWFWQSPEAGTGETPVRTKLRKAFAVKPRKK